MKELKRGIYRHYKGSEYRILHEAVNTENKDINVIYQDIKNDKKIWSRPKKIFTSTVKVEDKEKPRFEFVREEDSETSEKQYLRALADYQNLLKQTAKDKEEYFKYALNDFLQDIIPVYDHLKLSVKGLSEDEGKSPWAIGVGHVLKQFKDILEARGVEEIKTVGEKYDHNTMEAIDGTGEIVEKEIMPGYKLNGRVIKPAKVIVN